MPSRASFLRDRESFCDGLYYIKNKLGGDCPWKDARFMLFIWGRQNATHETAILIQYTSDWEGKGEKKKAELLFQTGSLRLAALSLKKKKKWKKAVVYFPFSLSSYYYGLEFLSPLCERILWCGYVNWVKLMFFFLYCFEIYIFVEKFLVSVHCVWATCLIIYAG